MKKNNVVCRYENAWKSQFPSLFSQNQDNKALPQAILAGSWLLCVRSDRDTADYMNRWSKSPTKYAPIADHNRVHKDLSHALAVSHAVGLQDNVRDLSRVDCTWHCTGTSSYFPGVQILPLPYSANSRPVYFFSTPSWPGLLFEHGLVFEHGPLFFNHVRPLSNSLPQRTVDHHNNIAHGMMKLHDFHIITNACIRRTTKTKKKHLQVSVRRKWQ